MIQQQNFSLHLKTDKWQPQFNAYTQQKTSEWKKLQKKADGFENPISSQVTYKGSQTAEHMLVMLKTVQLPAGCKACCVTDFD